MNPRRFIFIILFVAVNGCKKDYPQPETHQAGNNKWVVTKSVYNNNQNVINGELSSNKFVLHYYIPDMVYNEYR